jgi:hypothetical protein
MSHLLARIMLALLMLPLGTLAYVVVFVGADKSGGGFNAFVLADVVSGAFVAAYWVLLWRKFVAWTSRRLGVTAGAAAVAAVAGLGVGGWGADHVSPSRTIVALWRICQPVRKRCGNLPIVPAMTRTSS